MGELLWGPQDKNQICAHPKTYRCLCSQVFRKDRRSVPRDITEEASAETAASIHFGDEIGRPPPSHRGRQFLARFF